MNQTVVEICFFSLSYWSNGLFTYQVLIIKRVVLYTYLLWPGCSHRTWTNEWIVFKNSCINQVYCVQCWKGQSIFISIGRDIWSKDIWRKTHRKDKGAILDGKILDMCLNKLSQLGTEKVPHGGQHFWKPYGGFWRSMGP